MKLATVAVIAIMPIFVAMSLSAPSGDLSAASTPNLEAAPYIPPSFGAVAIDQQEWDKQQNQQQILGDILAHLVAKYRFSNVEPNRWSASIDPASNFLDEQQIFLGRAMARRSPAISIAAPIDVLRKSWERERTKQQMQKNRSFLNSLN